MSQAPDAAFTTNADNYCYRHPNRASFVLCQRCGRTICPECQVQAAVGVHCVECAKANRPVQPKPRIVTAFSSRSSAPVVTFSIIGLTVAFFILQQIPGLGVTSLLQYAGVYTQPSTGAPLEPWRMLTSLLLHGSIFHILFNMYALYVFGRLLEQMLGRGRYLTLYLLAGLGGSVAVDLLAPANQGVIGASGAIFGLMGAFFVIHRKLGGTSVQLLVLVGINLVIGFIPGLNIAWQAHVGGLVIGALIGLIFVSTRAVRKKQLQLALLTAVGVGLVALTVVRAVV